MLCLPTKIARVLDGPVMKFLLIIAWLNGLTYLILTLFPECSVIYWLENVGWEYTQENWCPLIDRLEFYLNVGQCLLGAIFYIIIIGNLVYLAIIIGGYVVVAEVVFHSAEVFIPDNMLASFLGNILWIGECGLTPYVYLMINTTLRNAFIEFVRCKKPHVTSVQRSWIT
uniref:7TM GPCR serpentine receptor class x (Srx) domain-containing protein n=1 Tax=Acrobeloides nanus TaxID=290746 RepID=A0A914DHL4_9BILA